MIIGSQKLCCTRETLISKYYVVIAFAFMYYLPALKGERSFLVPNLVEAAG